MCIVVRVHACCVHVHCRRLERPPCLYVPPLHLLDVCTATFWSSLFSGCLVVPSYYYRGPSARLCVRAVCACHCCEAFLHVVVLY